MTKRQRLAALSPDGVFYLAAARGAAVPKPYCRRWLPPAICGESITRWRIVGVAALVLAAALIGTLGASTLEYAIAVWLFAWLPGIVRVNLRLPVLVDAPAFALALTAALLWRSGHPVAAVGVALVAGACKESAPVLAACWALAPWLLIGILGAAWWRAAARPSELWLQAPVREAFRLRRVWGLRRWLDAAVTPWGALLPLALLGAAHAPAALAAAAGLSLVVGYGQLLVAQDNARLYQWAAPALIPLALLVLMALPAVLVVVILVAHVVRCIRSLAWKGPLV